MPEVGYARKPLPYWIGHGVVFAVRGGLYRVRAIGSVNDIHMGCHFRDYVSAEALDAPWEGLPEAPASKGDVAASLKSLRGLPRFFAEDLQQAIHRA